MNIITITSGAERSVKRVPFLNYRAFRLSTVRHPAHYLLFRVRFYEV